VLTDFNSNICLTLFSTVAGGTGPTGPAGANGLSIIGPTGPCCPGPTGPGGDPGLTWQEDWSSLTSYFVNDGVFNPVDGSSYISLQNGNLNNPPETSPAFWGLLAESGADGKDGVTGPPGGTGPTGPGGLDPSSLLSFAISSNMAQPAGPNVQANGVVDWTFNLANVNIFDPDGMFNGSTTVTVNKAGTFRVTARLWGNTGSANDVRGDITILHNGSSDISQAMNGAVVGQDPTASPGNMILPMFIEGVFTNVLAGDTFSVMVVTDLGSLGYRSGYWEVVEIV
jgi:hypothetical protein